MATTVMTRLSERWLDEVLLHGRIVNTIGAAFAEFFRLPEGIGDVAIMEAQIDAFNIASLPASIADWGLIAQVVSSDETTTLDILGNPKLLQTGTLRLGAYISPDPLVLWRAAERVLIQGPELDDDAAPTGDLDVFIKVVRIPQAEQETKRPIRLVR